VTHLVELFSHMIRICQHCWIVTRYLVKGYNRAIIARDVPPMSDTSKHGVEITVGLYGRVRVDEAEDSMRKDEGGYCQTETSAGRTSQIH